MGNSGARSAVSQGDNLADGVYRPIPHYYRIYLSMNREIK